MTALLKRTGYVAVMIAAVTLAACSGNEPPETQPTQPPPPAAPAPQPERNTEAPAADDRTETEAGADVLSISRINEEGLLQTIYFDHDESEIRPDQRAKLQANAQFLRENTNFRLLVAGHCDERGTREYNMALGEQRANATMQYLVSC